MEYQTFKPHPDLESIINCYWTLKVPASKEAEKQRIVPDGCIEMAFILADDIKRFTSEEEFILQPKSMVIGQITEPFYIQPVGEVNTFAVRFYPFSFANLIKMDIKSLVNKETPIRDLFGDDLVGELETGIKEAKNTAARIDCIEDFLRSRLTDKFTLDNIVQSTVESILATGGSMAIKDILKEDLSKRRQLERNFSKQIGMSPKQLGKVIRLQAALKLLINKQSESLTQVAYKSDYYDQAHFIKDFKDITGINPKEFLGDKSMELSTLFYTES